MIPSAMVYANNRPFIDKAFTAACRHGNVHTALELLLCGAHVPSNLGVLAAGYLTTDIVRLLLAHETSIDWNQPFMCAGVAFTPLSIAIRMKKHSNVCELLQSEKVLCFGPCAIAFSPLHIAVLHGRPKTITLLVEYFKSKKYMHGLSILLHFACAERCAYSTFEHIVQQMPKEVVNQTWLPIHASLLHIKPAHLVLRTGFAPLQTLCVNAQHSNARAIIFKCSMLIRCSANPVIAHFAPCALLAMHQHPETTLAAQILHRIYMDRTLMKSVAFFFQDLSVCCITNALQRGYLNPESSTFQAAFKKYNQLLVQFPCVGNTHLPVDNDWQSYVKSVLQHGWQRKYYHLYPPMQQRQMYTFFMSNWKSECFCCELALLILSFWQR